MTLAFSGTVLGLQRLTQDSIKVTIRDTKGLVYELHVPFSQEQFSNKLPFSLDDMVNVHIDNLSTGKFNDNIGPVTGKDAGFPE